MLEESGTIVKIDADALLVETMQSSACHSCSAQKGCGQHALGKAMASTTVIRVPLDGRSPGNYQLNQQVVIGIPEQVIVQGAMFVYLVPLIFLVIFAVAGFRINPGDGFVAVSGILGLGLGGLVVKWLSNRGLGASRIQPVLVR